MITRKVDNSKHYLNIIDDYIPGLIKLLPKSAIIFGGAVRDIIRFGKIEGDVDILLTKEEYDDLDLTYIATHSLYQEYDKTDEYKYMIGDEIIDYIHNNGNKIQFIINNKYKKSYFVGICDFVCCCVALSMNGDLYECQENAVDDCAKELLYVNEETICFGEKYITSEELIYNGICCLPVRSMKRAEKLMKRGWKIGFRRNKNETK